jgi:hypothetical protein
LKPPVRGGYSGDWLGGTYIADMVKSAISQEAFDAIAGAMPVESVGFAQTNERGERLIISTLLIRLLDKAINWR